MRPLVSVVALCLLAGAAYASDDEAPQGTVAERTLGTAVSPAPDRIEPVPIRPDANLLFGRISRNLERSGASARLNYIADRTLAGARSDVGTIGAGKTLARATTSAVKSILQDMVEHQTGLDEYLDRLQNKRNGASDVSAGAPGGTRVRFQVGTYQYLPRLDVRLDGGAVATKVSVSAYGNVGVDLAPAASSRVAFHGGYDARSNTSEVRCLFRF